MRSKLKELIYDLCDKNIGIIKTLPLLTQRSDLCSVFKYNEEIQLLAKNEARYFFDKIENDLKINLNGHNQIKLMSYIAYQNKYPLGRLVKDRILNKISYLFYKSIMSNAGRDCEDKEYAFELLLGLSSVFTDYPDYLLLFSDFSCKECGTVSNVSIDLKSNCIRQHDDVAIVNNGIYSFEECSFNNNPKENAVEITIKSGKIIIANALTRILPESEYRNAENYIASKSSATNDICSSLGRKLNTEYFASKNILYHHAAPYLKSIYFDKEKNTIGFYDSSRITKKFKDEKHLDFVGNIDLELWAITAMDYDLFIMHCKNSNLNPVQQLSELQAIMIDVPNGVYQCTNYIDDKKNKRQTSNIKLKKRA